MAQPKFKFIEGVEVIEREGKAGGTTADPVCNEKIIVKGLISRDSLASILGVQSTELEQHWNNDDMQSPKLKTINSVKLKNLHKEMVVNLGDLEFNKATVQGMEYGYADNECALLKTTIGVLGISPEESSAITKMLGYSQDCSVSPMQGDMLDDEEDKAEKAA